MNLATWLNTLIWFQLLLIKWCEWNPLRVWRVVFSCFIYRVWLEKHPPRLMRHPLNQLPNRFSGIFCPWIYFTISLIFHVFCPGISVDFVDVELTEPKPSQNSKNVFLNLRGCLCNLGGCFSSQTHPFYIFICVSIQSSFSRTITNTFLQITISHQTFHCFTAFFPFTGEKEGGFPSAMIHISHSVFMRLRFV